MQKIRITGDSSWDMPVPGFVSIPLTVTLGDEDYLDGVNMTNEDIYAYYRETGRTPKTAAIPPALYEEVFERELKTHDAIVHISLSSHISACHNNAKLVAKNYDNVYVIDGLSLSCGLALLGLDAAGRAEEGMPADKIAARLEHLKHKVQTSFVVDTLEFLHKGGRCSGLARFAASLLKIRPTIIMKGSMSVGKKYMGTTFASAINKYIDDIFERHTRPDLRWLFITYSTAAPEILEMTRDKIARIHKFEHVHICHTGGTITSHCGENTIGLAFLNK